jgi:DNA-3-methyladenine glycosylase
LARKRLTKPFFERDALTVARELIGCVFVHDDFEGRTAVRLVETEAYRGPIDPGSHGYRGMTPRTEVMYGPPAHLYVYFTYGMHWCANIVCASSGHCEAVLLRAGEPVEGIDLMRFRRPKIKKDSLLASGPARLTRAMGIGPEHNGAGLLRGGSFWCYEDEESAALSKRTSQTLRIGLSKGRGDDIPWRFVVPGHAHASRPR